MPRLQNRKFRCDAIVFFDGVYDVDDVDIELGWDLGWGSDDRWIDSWDGWVRTDGTEENARRKKKEQIMLIQKVTVKISICDEN